MSWVAALERIDGSPSLVVSEEADFAAPQRAERDSCAVVFEGRLHSGRADAAAAIVDAYLTGGEPALRRLDGWFALVVWDGRTETLFAVRDALGVQPLFYTDTGPGISLAPTVAAPIRSEGGNEPNALAIAADILGNPCGPEETFFIGVRRLPPGHILTFRSGVARVERYWEPVCDGQPATGKAAAAELEELLRAGVSRSLELGPAGVFLSGGLDSALVAAITADVSRHEGRTPPLMLSVLFEGTDVDEESTQLAVARGLGLDQLAVTANEALGGKGVLGETIELAAVTSCPPEFLQPIYDRLTLAARARGVSVVLSGAGGDEFLMPPAAYAGERFRSLDLPGLVRLGQASLGYWPESTWRSVARSLLVTRGIRPVAVAGAAGVLTRLAPDRLRRMREDRLAATIPHWLVPEREFRRRATDHLVEVVPSWRVRSQLGGRASDFLDDVSLSNMWESSYDSNRRLGVRLLAPILEPDVVAFLSNLTPRLLIDHGKAKALARHVLAPRLPTLAHSWPRTVYADSLWQRALEREGARAWSVLGGTPLLAELGVVDEGLLGARIKAGRPGFSGREAARVCRTLVLERWLGSRILPRSARR